jgi:antitoxin (DNA-binding transcriptional repressor) of toxin-antitoxin stability system
LFENVTHFVAHFKHAECKYPPTPRHPPTSWLEAGEVVELRKRNIVVARIVPESPKIEQSKRPVKWPDFAARRRAIFGDRQINAVEILIEERNSRY